MPSVRRTIEREIRRRRRPRRRTASLGEAMVKGAVAGAAGSVAMLVVAELEARAAAGDLGARARGLAPKIRGGGTRARAAAPTRRPRERIGVEIAIGAAIGAVYGVVQTRVRLPEAAHGAVLGALTYAVHATGWLPAGGVLAPPPDASLQDALTPAGTHAVFGLATARAFDLLTG